MVNINQTDLGLAVVDSTDLMGPATHVEINGRHFVVNHYTADPICGAAQRPDGLRVYEVTDASGNGSGPFNMVNVDQIPYSAAGNGLGVHFPFGSTDKMTVFEKNGKTFLAQNTTEKYILWEMDGSGNLSHAKSITKPTDIDGTVVNESLEVHVADDGSVTLMQAGFDYTKSVADQAQPTDHSIWVTKLDSNFNLQSSVELGHADSQNATSPFATTDIHSIDIGNNEKLVYGTGDPNSIAVWKIAADGTISELPEIDFPGRNTINQPLTSNANSVQMDSIYNPVDGKTYLAATGSYAGARNAMLWEVDTETGALTKVVQNSSGANSGFRWHAVDGDGDGQHDDGFFRDLSSIQSIELGVDEVTGDMYVTAHSRVTTYDHTPTNHPSNGVFPSDYCNYGGVATYTITQNNGNYNMTISEGTMATKVSGRTDSATTFTINGQTVTVGFDAWGTDGDQPNGGRSLWVHDASFSTETPPVCFVRGTRIMTPTGEVAIENLRAGDKVVTRDGVKPIRWIGSSRKRASGKLVPIRIAVGALGGGLPERDLLVSRQHRMVVQSDLAAETLGTPEVLVAAIKLTALPGVEEVTDMERVEYFHMLFDGHQIVYAESSPSESLYLGPEALKSLRPEARAEIEALFPECIDTRRPASALPIPKLGTQKSIAQALADREMVYRDSDARLA
ncbi:MAG: Hint domain-containing protein [Silicimonas sp.]|nr:Hint domain-containing protein [Silicimonas sp.]